MFANAVAQITRKGETRWPDLLHAFAQMENARLTIQDDPLAKVLFAAGPLDPNDRKLLEALLIGPAHVPTWMKDIFDATRDPKTRDAVLDMLTRDDNIHNAYDLF